MTRKYELMVLLPASLSSEDLEKATKKYVTMIETAKGKAVVSSVLGKKPLSYTIKKLKEAHYVLFNFELEPGGLKEVQTKFQQDETVLRHLLIRVD